MPAGRPGGGVSTLIPYSILDLVPVTEGSDARRAFANMIELARLAERLGYRRYWLAEHHNMPGIASAATAVLIGHVAGATSTIRVGCGRHHAAEPRAAAGGGAVRHAGLAVSRDGSTSGSGGRPAPTWRPRVRCAAITGRRRSFRPT